MKQIIFFIFLSFASVSKGQTSIYHPFPDSNAYWNIIVEVYCAPMNSHVFDHHSVEIGGDTLIGGIQYHTFQVPFIQSGSNGVCPYYQSGYKGAFRQDTTLRKVYIISPGDSLEQILYDFSLNVGDTVSGYLVRDLPTVETVISIDSIIIGGSYRKRWLINSIYPLYMTEGVGWHYGLIVQSSGILLDATNINMTCFTQNGIVLFNNGFPVCDLIDQVERNNQEQTIFSYPNPATSTTKVKLPLSFVNGRFEVYDINGKLIEDCSVGENVDFEFDVTSFRKGIYFMKFYSVEGKNTSLKLIKE